MIGVQNLEASVRLYRDGCGLEVFDRGTAGHDAVANGTPPPETVRLGRRDVPGAASLRLVTATGRPGRSAGCSGSLGPLGTGFTTGDIHRVHERLEGHGVRFLSPPLELSPDPGDDAGPRRFEAFSQTGDGEFVVLVERRRAPSPYGTIDPGSLLSEPVHTSHVVDDLDACCRFMERVLDHRVLFSERCAGETFERLMALDRGSTFRFRMLCHPDRETGRIIFIEFDGGERAASRRTQRPHRGLIGLTYTADDLDRRLDTARSLGAAVLPPPGRAAGRAAGSGPSATVVPPFNILLELRQTQGPLPG